jgi:hypothetical protein
MGNNVADMSESLLLPEWSERVDERGTPTDPLNGNRSRNRLSSLFSHGLITSIPLRLRYASVFCWAIDQISGEDSEEDPYYLIKNVEKLFCLSSRYQQLDQEQDGVIAAMDGNSRFSYDMDEFDEIILDDLELLKNDGYAYSQFYEGLLQSFLLKRGDLNLTTAGEQVAEIVDGHIGSAGEKILQCASEGRATRQDFEEFSYALGNQSLYLKHEFEDERHALQKVLLGLLNWRGDRSNGTIELPDSLPDGISLSVLERLKKTIEEGELEEAGASKLYQKYHRGYHRYRTAHSLFLLRSWQLESEATEGQNKLHLTNRDLQAFGEYRELMQTYWLQVYASYVFEAQLEALSSFLNSRIPARYDYESLLDNVIDEKLLSQTIQGIKTGLNVERESEKSPQKSITRDLMLYGDADRYSLDVSAPRNGSESLKVGEVKDMVEETFPEAYNMASSSPVAESDKPNMILSAKAVRKSLNGILASENIDDENSQFECWTEALGRCIWLLFLVSHRFGAIEKEREWYYNYSYNRLDSTFASLPSLRRFVVGLDDNEPIEKVARDFVEEKVVETHLRVFYDRLRPGNIKRMLSFDQDNCICLEVDKEHSKKLHTASPSFIRFSELNIFLRDADLLMNAEDMEYRPTDRAEEILSLLPGGSGQ